MMDSTLQKLETALAATLEAHRGAIDAWRNGGSLDACRAAHADVMEAERALSRAREEETAGPLVWEYPCEAGAPTPFVLSDGNRVLLGYYVRESAVRADPNEASSVGDPVAVVLFERCTAHRLGPPNDEAIEGHPLFGRGLTPYGAHLVERSAWIAELERRNRVHRCHRPEAYLSLRHYLLTFHDETFECLAQSHRVELRFGSVRETVLDAARTAFDY